MRTVVEIALQLPARIVACGNDALARRLELLLLPLSLRDLANDHEELLVATGGEATLVVTFSVLEVERVFDHVRSSGNRSPSRREHAVGKVARQAIPERLADDLVVDEIVWIRRVVREVLPVARDAEHQVGHGLQEGEVALCPGPDLDQQLVALERDSRRVRDPCQQLRLFEERRVVDDGGDRVVRVVEPGDDAVARLDR